MTAGWFVTPTGMSVPAVDSEQMRQIDRIAIDETGPNLFQMMENAGRNLAITVIERLGPEWAERQVVVLAGTGGNGGGGICAARHLANRGANVTLVVTRLGRLGGVPAHQLAVYRATEGRLAEPGKAARLTPDLVVDALIGYGLVGPPAGVTADLIGWVRSLTVPVVALDVPSGLDSTSGEAPGAWVEAQLTLTLALPKTGLDVPAVGDLRLADIGIPVGVYRRLGLDVPIRLFGDRFCVPLVATEPTT